MNKKILFIIICMLFCIVCNAKDSEKKITENRAKDLEWKNYITTIQKKAEEEHSIENAALFWTAFESYAPCCGNYNQIKDKIKTKHRIKKYKEIKIPTRDGLKLEGWFIPVQNAKATVIVLHGSGSDLEFALCQSKFLLDLGYQIIVYNCRFWNYWKNPKEYRGDFHKDVSDVEDVYNYACKLKGVDKNKVGLIGFSKGARKAIVAGGKYSQLKFIIADAASTFWGQKISEEEIEHNNAINQYIINNFGFSVIDEENDPYHMVDKISPRPLLLLHGEKDTFVDIKCSQILFDKAHEPKQIKTFAKSGHCLGMMTSDKNDYINTVNDFLDNINF